MTLYDELVARGLIAQVTDEEEIKDLSTMEKQYFISVLTRQLTVCMWDILWHCV